METGSSAGCWGGWNEEPFPWAQPLVLALEAAFLCDRAQDGAGHGLGHGQRRLWCSNDRFSLCSSQPSWTPGWVLEDAALGPGAILTSEDAQAWDIGQEGSPRMQEAKRTV